MTIIELELTDYSHLPAAECKPHDPWFSVNRNSHYISNVAGAVELMLLNVCKMKSIEPVKMECYEKPYCRQHSIAFVFDRK